MWSVECAVWSVQCGVCRVECAAWSVECAVCRVELEYALRPALTGILYHQIVEGSQPGMDLVHSIRLKVQYSTA